MASKIFPGSGKGTISQRIAKSFGLEHLSTGDFLRSSISTKEDVELLAKQYLDRGHLVPDPVTAQLMLGELKKTGGQSFPHTLPQAKALNSIYELDLGIDDLTGEILIQRDDDKPEVVATRLRQYKGFIKPVIDFYKTKGILHTFSRTETDKIWPCVYSLMSARISPRNIAAPVIKS
ncbi:adenylate kinase 4, mitochondrial [Cetorhinus maximus]